MPTKELRPPKIKKQNHHYVERLLEKVKEGKTALDLGAHKRIFSQGDRAEALFFIESGKVKISVVSTAGKEATLFMLGPREFFGEGCLVGQTVQMGTAETLEPSKIFRLDKSAMVRAIHSRPEFAETFVSLLLARNIALEEDLCDQLFNHSEKRLARALLKLSRLGNQNATPDVTIPLVSHEILAEMIGTTRPRVTYFMNKFRKLGLIDYNGKTVVRAALLTDVVLSD
ncbi:MAG TPA: Crp/Fnr family transcriptional regulator [Acidobacteriota bacterium]|nr:Crp/Fnr family transcriptional regulator [Acidobacteriota bacterium]